MLFLENRLQLLLVHPLHSFHFPLLLKPILPALHRFLLLFLLLHLKRLEIDELLLSLLVLEVVPVDHFQPPGLVVFVEKVCNCEDEEAEENDEELP